MILEQKSENIKFVKQGMEFTFLPDGDIFEFTSGSFMVNQFQGNPVDGSANNIYLRIYNGGQRQVIPLLGRQSNSELFIKEEKGLFYRGIAAGIQYEVAFLPTEYGIWFWNIELEGNNVEVDFLYGQDIGVADKGGVLTNELYISQYLDHKILSGEYGYVVCSRQNQSQGGKFPYLQQGAFNTEIIRYSTDGMQFFGKSYKETGIPEALTKDLENSNYQYELSYTALQTKKIKLSGKETVTFYGCFKDNHENAVTELEYLEEIKEAYQQICKEVKQQTEVKLAGAKLKQEFGTLFSSESFTNEEIKTYFPDRILEEKKEDRLLSFFTKDHRHIVLKEKELLVERPHGNIITTLIEEDTFEKPLITSTNYMYGFFNGQITIGNTNMNKFLSVNRGLLNVQKNTGQRIFIKLNETFRLLALPSAFEMGFNYSKWYYKIEDDLIIITSFAAADTTDLVLDVTSKKGKEYEFLITNQLVLGGNEFTDSVVLEEREHVLSFTPAQGSVLKNTYPNLAYKIHLTGADYTYCDDRIFYEDNCTRNGTLLTLLTKAADFRITINGTLEGERVCVPSKSTAEEEYQTYVNFYRNFLNGFSMDSEEMKEQKEETKRLNEIVWWYTHNAFIHFAVPHGLEQSGGAAWGTRDVCQGPMEYFLTTGHTKLAREVLLKIFAHQAEDTGEWPQWFMFDRYPYHADDCHGDVVFWPLKAIGDYLETTGDISILEEEVPFLDTSSDKNPFSNYTIINHIKCAFDAIDKRFLYDTALISYAGGDWDDTLQPANKALKEKLVSAWTQALAYHTLQTIGEQLLTRDESLAQKACFMAKRIKEDFNRYLIKDGVIAGFAYLESKDEIRYMLHPDDKETGIHYRLLPLTRSIICGLVEKEQVKENIHLIEEHLACPDGVRLMDFPARYEGGISRYFMRAEQAANVGREISLQYVHAHIRYIQAMTVAGEAEKAWNGLVTVLPIGLKETVKNAAYRQSNAYFSSSEGAYQTRYEYQEQFDLLKKGEIEVKGGWRIYSSGPGIYLSRLITDVLGIKVKQNKLGIDPVLPESVSGLKTTFYWKGQPFTIRYIASGKKEAGIEVMAGERKLFGERIKNPYRIGGLWLEESQVQDVILSGKELIVLY